MSTIGKPISDLINYDNVLRNVAVGAPVFLTQNGKCRYALLDMRDYEMLKLFSQLQESESAIQNGDVWLTPEEVDASLGI